MAPPSRSTRAQRAWKSSSTPPRIDAEEGRQREGRHDADEQRRAVAQLLAQVLERDVEGGAHGWRLG